MLTIYRRHLKTCAHHASSKDENVPASEKGAQYLQCRCPLWCIGQIDNKPIRQSLHTRDMQRAIRLAERMERPNSERTDLIPCAQPGCNERVERGRCAKHRQCVAGAIEAFHAAHTDLEHGTKISYKRTLEAFQQHAEGISAVHEVQPDAIDRFRAKRAVSASTWKKELQLLRHFFRFCMQRKWTLDNPASAIAMPKNIKPTDKEPYSPNEVIKIVAACDTLGRASYERLRARAMVLTLRYTALRISDVATLRRDCIRNGEVYLRTLKNGKVVKLPLQPQLKEALDAVPAPRSAEGESRYFFWSGNGTTRSAIRDATRTLTAVFKASKVPGAHAHRFRHTLATELLELGGTLEDVADILGNSPNIVRKHYAKWSSRRQERISALMRAVFPATRLDSSRTPHVHEENASATASIN